MASSVANESERGINWFEGGRRISKLLMGLVAAIAAFFLFATNADYAVFSTAGPSEPWQFRNGRCEDPDYSRYVSDVDVGTKRETVILCFDAASDGKIPYAVAPEPEDAARGRRAREQRQAAEDRAAVERGAPPVIRTTALTKWYYTGGDYSDAVQTYVDAREQSFRITPEMAKAVRDSSAGRLWQARMRGVSDVGPWVFGLIAFIWILTAVVGWIVRGFAGVPWGADFRPPRS
jgi:hypothetical protein